MITDVFKKYLSQKLYAKTYRIFLNFWPCIRGGGGKVVFISDDFHRLKVKLNLDWRSRNLVGTIYGGSMYASTDPMFMLMLIEILGKEFVVWDKGCTIRFRRPAKTAIFAEFEITPSMEADVRERVARENEITFTWKVEYKDVAGNTYCEFDKVLYVAKKDYYSEKMRKRQRS
jgi:hypothetical protein